MVCLVGRGTWPLGCKSEAGRPRGGSGFNICCLDISFSFFCLLLQGWVFALSIGFLVVLFFSGLSFHVGAFQIIRLSFTAIISFCSFFSFAHSNEREGGYRGMIGLEVGVNQTIDSP